MTQTHNEFCLTPPLSQAQTFTLSPPIGVHNSALYTIYVQNLTSSQGCLVHMFMHNITSKHFLSLTRFLGKIWQVHKSILCTFAFKIWQVCLALYTFPDKFWQVPSFLCFNSTHFYAKCGNLRAYLNLQGLGMCTFSSKNFLIHKSDLMHIFWATCGFYKIQQFLLPQYKVLPLVILHLAPSPIAPPPNFKNNEKSW